MQHPKAIFLWKGVSYLLLKAPQVKDLKIYLTKFGWPWGSIWYPWVTFWLAFWKPWSSRSPFWPFRTFVENGWRSPPHNWNPLWHPFFGHATSITKLQNTWQVGFQKAVENKNIIRLRQKWRNVAPTTYNYHMFREVQPCPLRRLCNHFCYTPDRDPSL